jgi:hypothetical protein
MDYIICLDFLGKKPNILINGSLTNKTLLGGILSILVTLTLAAGTSYFVQLLFSRDSYNVVLNDEYNLDSFKSWKNEEFSVTLMDRVLDEIPNADRIFGITGTWWVNREHYSPVGSVSYKLEMYDVKMEKCNLTKHFNDIDLWKNEKLINSSMCFARDQDFNSSKIFGANNYTGLVLWIHRCHNSTTKNDCLPIEEIDKALLNVFFLVRFKDYYLDHKMSGYNAVPYIFSDSVQASSSAYKRIWYNFRNVEYQTDEGYIFPDVKSTHLTNLAGTRESVDIRTDTTIPGSFSVVSLNMWTLKQIYKKSYYKAQNMLADLGGLFKGIISLATILNYYFSDKNLYCNIINSNIHSYVSSDFSILGHKPYINPENFSAQKVKGSTKDVYNYPSNYPSNKIFLDLSEKSSNDNLRRQTKFDINLLAKKRNSMYSSEIGINKESQIKENEIIFKNCKILKNQDINECINNTRFKFTIRKILLPLFCYRTRSPDKCNIKLFSKISDYVKKQLDVCNIVKNSNTLNKFNYVFTGERQLNSIEKCVNPSFYEGEIISNEYIELKEKLARTL